MSVHRVLVIPSLRKFLVLRKSTENSISSMPGNERRDRSRYQNVEQRHGGVRHEEVRGHRSTRKEAHYGHGPALPALSGVSEGASSP